MTSLTADAASGRSASRRHSIVQLPINLFASVMGLTGLALAWREAVHALGLPAWPGEIFGWLGVAAFIALAVGYGIKFARHPATVIGEFNHPILGNFFGAIAIGLLVLSAFLGRYEIVLGEGIWMLGTVLTLVLAFLAVQKFLTVPQKPETLLPPLILPGAAALDIPVTGAAMPFDWAHQLNLFAFAIGTVMALVLVVLLFQRLRHADALPPANRPMLMMLVAPFAIGFLAYTNLNQVDMLAAVLIYFGWFLFLVLSPVVFRLENSFGIGWWAISFPLAALSIASFRYAAANGGGVLTAMATLLLAFTTVSIGILAIRTLHLVLSGRLFRLETA